jgi:hypothetical protein
MKGFFFWFLLHTILVANIFYSAALLGWFLENRKTSIKILFVPYYFFNNLSVVLGFFRYIKGSTNWERSKRAI